MQGVISGAFIGLIVIMIVNLFHIRDKKITFFIALAFVAFPSVASIYTYMFTSSQYFLSVFLAVAGAYLIIRRKWAGAILLAFSIGVYQVFIAVALSVLLLSMIADILQKRVSGMREIGLTTIRYGICVLLGLLIYILILKTTLWVSGTTLTDYQGIGSFSISNLFSNIPLAYENFFLFFDKHFDLRSYFGVFVFFSDLISVLFLGIAVYRNNVTYAMSEMTYSNAMSYYNRICSRIEEHDAYDPDIKIALIGSISFQNKIPKRRLTGAVVGEEAFNMYSRYSFYHNYLGATYNWATTKEISNIAAMEEFKNMPIYPRHGSIRKIGEYLVVKFSDYE